MPNIPTVEHIGVEKTATTTIQTFLASNKSSLEKIGLSRLTCFGPNQRDLAGLCYNKKRVDDWTIKHSISHEKGLDALREAIRSRLASEVSSIGSDTTLIITSEHLHSRLTTEPEVAKFGVEMENVGLDIRAIIIYLRRPWRLAQSLFSTLVRSGYSEYSPPKPHHPIMNPMCDYAYTINLWKKSFPRSKIHVRLFEQALRGEGILYDFISTASLSKITADDFSTIFSVPHKYENKALSCSTLAAIISLNRFAKHHSLLDNKNLRRLRYELEVSPGRQDDAYRIERNLAGEYDDFFQQSCRAVEHEYFNGSITELTKLSDFSSHPEASLGKDAGIDPLISILFKEKDIF